MALLLSTCPSYAQELIISRRKEVAFPWLSPLKRSLQLGSVHNQKNESSSRGSVNAFFFNPSNEPILKEALKEPVAFMGGMFAGLLRLDLNEEPLREWVTRTVEASGMTEEEIAADGSKPEEQAPQEIEIE